MEFRLLVIRTPDIAKLADFYTLLGFKFEYHKHGNSPYHYSAPVGHTILEIYPLAKDQTGADHNLRLGFAIDNFENIVDVLKNEQVIFVAEPAQTEYGFMTIIKDPDGRKIELHKK